MTTSTNGNGKVKLAVHETRIENIEKNVDLILTNHLPHIDSKLEGINKWLIGVMGSLILALILLVVNLVVK